MAYSRAIWNQLKGLTLKELAKALQRDGWIAERRAAATVGFIKTTGNGAATRRRVVLHVHPGKSFGPRLLKALLDDIGWSEDDLIRLKLIRKPSPKGRRQTAGRTPPNRGEPTHRPRNHRKAFAAVW